MFQDWVSGIQHIVDMPFQFFGLTSLTSGKIVLAVVAILVTFVVTRLIEQGNIRLAQRGNSVLSPSGIYALSRILIYLAWIVGGIFGVQVLGINLSSFALFGGAVGIGVGLGLQSIFSNFVSGVVLLLEKTLKVGDYVELESGAAGRVSEVNVRFTRITTNDLVDILVPNSQFMNGQVRNWSYKDPHRRLHIPFSVAYGSDKKVVRAAGLEAAAAVAGTVTGSGRDADVWLVGFGDSALSFELIVWVGQKMASTPSRTRAAYLWALEDALRNHGLVVPFPQRDVHLVTHT